MMMGSLRNETKVASGSVTVGDCRLEGSRWHPLQEGAAGCGVGLFRVVINIMLENVVSFHHNNRFEDYEGGWEVRFEAGAVHRRHGVRVFRRAERYLMINRCLDLNICSRVAPYYCIIIVYQIAKRVYLSTMAIRRIMTVTIN